MNGQQWSETQIEKLIELYPDCYKVDDLVSIIGRELKSIYQKANSLKLKRNSNQGNKNLAEFGNKFRFKKGHEAWNKGMKGLQIGGIETRFKKGDIPKTTKYFGKPYLVNRINSKGNYETFWCIQKLGSNKRLIYSRFLWEQEKGKIPANHIVYYLHGVDKTKPPTIEDLGIMERKDNMARNTIHQYPRELRKSIKLLNKLKKQIVHETDKLR